MIRSDSAGDGRFNARRDGGRRRHDGVDIAVHEGEAVRSPIDGIFQRVAFPYSGDGTYGGMLIVGADVEVKMFYLRPDNRLMGQRVAKGQVVGWAQNIGNKYNDPKRPWQEQMHAHIHYEIVRVNPLLVLDLDVI